MNQYLAMLKKRSTSRLGLAVIGMGILLCLAFGGSLFNEYAYDGKELIFRWGEVPGAGWRDIFDPTRYGMVTGIYSWRPLGALLFLIVDNQLLGRNAALSHAFDLGIHFVNMLLVWYVGWLLLVQFTSREAKRGQAGTTGLPAWFPAFAGGLVFGVHPLVSEVVLCPGFRTDSLALLGILAMLALSVKTSSKKEKGAGWILVFYSAGLASKEVALAGLVLSPLACYWFGMNRRRLTMLVLGLGLLTALWYGVWLRFKYTGYPTSYLGGQGRILGMVNFCISSTEIYLSLLFKPWPLRIEHDFQPIAGFGSPRVMVSLGVLTVLAGGVVAAGAGNRACILGGLLVLLGFAPLSQVVPIPEPVAERFCYVPMAGVGLFASGMFSILESRFPSRAGVIYLCSLAWVVFLTFACHLRTRDWRNDLVLNITNWEDGPSSPKSMEYLGALYLKLGADQQARGELQASMQSLEIAASSLKALEIQEPGNPRVHRLLGTIALLSGDTTSAQVHSRTAASLDPEDRLTRELILQVNGMQPKGN